MAHEGPAPSMRGVLSGGISQSLSPQPVQGSEVFGPTGLCFGPKIDPNHPQRPRKGFATHGLAQLTLGEYSPCPPPPSLPEPRPCSCPTHPLVTLDPGRGPGCRGRQQLHRVITWGSVCASVITLH